MKIGRYKQNRKIFIKNIITKLGYYIIVDNNVPTNSSPEHHKTCMIKQNNAIWSPLSIVVLSSLVLNFQINHTWSFDFQIETIRVPR